MCHKAHHHMLISPPLLFFPQHQVWVGSRPCWACSVHTLVTETVCTLHSAVHYCVSVCMCVCSSDGMELIPGQCVGWYADKLLACSQRIMLALRSKVHVSVGLFFASLADKEGGHLSQHLCGHLLLLDVYSLQIGLILGMGTMHSKLDFSFGMLNVWYSRLL